MRVRIIKHGTHQGYQSGCKCIDCRAFNSEYAADLRGIQQRYGPIVALDTAAIRRMMERQEATCADVERRGGMPDGTLTQIIRRGRCGLFTADTIAAGLGVTYHSIVTDDLVSIDTACAVGV